jgi:hypothetical protein
VKTNQTIAGWLMLLALLFFNFQPVTCFAQGTAFSYQGQLDNNGSPANGLYDVRFLVWDAATNGNLVAGPLTNSATGVTNGLFAVTLDFGGGVFTGPARWLELDVRTNGTASFTPLLPFQPLLPMPYSIMANTASNLLSPLPAAQLTGTVPLAQLPPVILTNNASAVVLTGTFSGNGAGLTSINGGAIQNGTIGSAQLAPGTGVVPSGAIVLSATANNAALNSAGFNLMATGLGSVWSQVTNTTPWGAPYGGYLPRSTFSALAFNGQLWVLGGAIYMGGMGNELFNDVWSSSNGAAWTEATSSAGWGPRDWFNAVAFNGKMWVLGGPINGAGNDVWSSSDGATWTEVTNAAPWVARYNSAAVAFNGQMWVMGGNNFSEPYGLTNLSDVWSSSDGLTWVEKTSCAPWGPRDSFSVVACNGKLWLMGGESHPYTQISSLNDVWSSNDGITWNLVTNATPWGSGSDIGVVALNGQMFVANGSSGVWSSTDGAVWNLVTNSAPAGVATVAFNGQLWELGVCAAPVGGVCPVGVWASQSNTTNVLGGFYLFQKQ